MLDHKVNTIEISVAMANIYIIFVVTFCIHIFSSEHCVYYIEILNMDEIKNALSVLTL